MQIGNGFVIRLVHNAIVVMIVVVGGVVVLRRWRGGRADVKTAVEQRNGRFAMRDGRRR